MTIKLNAKETIKSINLWIIEKTINEKIKELKSGKKDIKKLYKEPIQKNLEMAVIEIQINALNWVKKVIKESKYEKYKRNSN